MGGGVLVGGGKAVVGGEELGLVGGVVGGIAGLVVEAVGGDGDDEGEEESEGCGEGVPSKICVHPSAEARTDGVPGCMRRSRRGRWIGRDGG